MQDAVIVSAVRTAVAKGKSDGALARAGVLPIDISSLVMREALSRAGVDGREVDDVVWGCAMPEASQGLNVARNAALRAAFPVDASAVTVNRFCSSGLQTIAQGVQAVMSGMQDVIVAGGVEMMSQVPMSGHHTRLHPRLTESYIGMGFTAERVAERWKVSREDQDAFAADSHRKAAAAWEANKFAGEIIPVPVEKVTWKGAEKHAERVEFARDELLRPETTAVGLAKLKPAFKPMGGTVTAGNSSPYSDGAAALMVVSRAKAEADGLKPLARFVGFATSGVDPDVMGIAPIKAVPKVLARTRLTMDDLDLIEMNEAFAAQALAVARVLEMPMDKLNVNGGAIALGHPLGATGAKLTTHLVHELGRRGGGLGMVTMCVGGGMGAAGIFEVYPA